MHDASDTTPQADPFVARSQEEADAEFEESLGIMAFQWGIPPLDAPRVLSEMDARGMEIAPDGIRYSDAAAVAVSLDIDPGHGEED